MKYLSKKLWYVSNNKFIRIVVNAEVIYTLYYNQVVENSFLIHSTVNDTKYVLRRKYITTLCILSQLFHYALQTLT